MISLAQRLRSTLTRTVLSIINTVGNTFASLACKRYVNRTKTPTYPGVLIREEKPLLVTTEVALVDPSDGQPTEVEWRHTESGDRVRVSLRTGRIIPMTGPVPTDEDDHFVEDVEKYQDSPKDTPKKELQKVTFEPKVCTFEQDIMEKMEIKEDRKPAPTYWY